MSEPRDVQQRIASIEGLVREIDNVADPAVRSLSKQLVQSLMDFHAAGMERMLEITHALGAEGQRIIDDLGRDELVGSLLLLYGLHPLDLRSRVAAAVEKVRPHLAAQNSGVELVDVTDSGAVTLRWQRHGGHVCSSTTAQSRSLVEQSISDAAPEVTNISIENLEPDPGAGFVPLSALLRGGAEETVAAGDCRGESRSL